MRYALISDIHSNLPALEAVLDDVRGPSVDAVFHLGDLVGYAPWPDEVVARIVEEGIPGVAGNYDSTVAVDYKHCGCRYEDPRQEELSHLSYEWTRTHVSPTTRVALGALPFRLDHRPGGGHLSGPKLVLVHGAPTLNTLYWTEDRDDAFCRQMAQRSGLIPGDIIAFGHTHVPWHRTVDGIHFLNTGSVGRPKDGDWRAGYALLEVDPDADPTEGDHVTVEHLRVPYDVERAARAIFDSELPDAFAHYLRSGGRSLDAVPADGPGDGPRPGTDGDAGR